MKKTQNTKSIKRKYPLTLDGKPAKNWRNLGCFDGFDFAGLSFYGRPLTKKYFTNVKNLTWRKIEKVIDFFFCVKLPDGMDFSGVSLKGKYICGIDFTKAKNLSARQLFEAEELDRVKLSDGMDFSGVSFKGKSIKGIDFSKVKNLTARHIFEADCLDYVILPADIIPGVSLEGNTITIYKEKA